MYLEFGKIEYYLRFVDKIIYLGLLYNNLLICIKYVNFMKKKDNNVVNYIFVKIIKI